MHVEQRFLLMFSELATKPLACQPSCSHGQSRQHISNYCRNAHEIERHQFKMSLTFVQKKNSHENLNTFEIIAAVGIHLRHKETYTDCVRHSLQLVAPSDSVSSVLARCGQLRNFLTIT